MKICHTNQDEREQDRERDHLNCNLPGYGPSRTTVDLDEMLVIIITNV